jgi:hypothetical protein
MPRSRYFQQLPPRIKAAFAAEKGVIDPWAKRLGSLLDRTRVLRNSIAHQGARELEIRANLTEEDLETAVKVLEFIVPRLQALALAGIGRRMTRVADVWNNYGILFGDTKAEVPPTADVVGTVIFFLSGEGQPRR